VTSALGPGDADKLSTANMLMAAAEKVMRETELRQDKRLVN